MGQPLGDQAYPDARAFMDRALDSETGYRIIFDTEARTKNFRMRCYTARDRERKRNLKIYELQDPMYGTSVYHTIAFVIKPVGAQTLCEVCRAEVKQWQLVATHSDNSMDTRCISHGPV